MSQLFVAVELANPTAEVIWDDVATQRCKGMHQNCRKDLKILELSVMFTPGRGTRYLVPASLVSRQWLVGREY